MKKNRKRIIAALMTVLMALTLVPTWLLGGVFVTTAKADGTTSSDKVHIFDAKDITDGKLPESDYFSFGDSDKVKTLEVSTNEKVESTVGDSFYKYVVNVGGKLTAGKTRGIVFTTKKTATITVVAATKGGKANKISIGKYTKEQGNISTKVIKEDDLLGEDANNKYPVKTYTFSDVEAGTYILGSSDNGVNIYSVTVVEEITGAAEAPTGLSIEAVQSTEDKAAINIKVSASKAGGDGSKYIIYRTDGNGKTETIEKVSKGHLSEVLITDIPKDSGEYTYTVKGVAVNADGVETIGEEEATSGKVVYEFPWNDVPSPSLSAVTKSGSKLQVKLEASINARGGDYAVVTMYRNGLEITSQEVTSDDASKKTLTFAPKEDGDYTFVATLFKSGYADKESEAQIYKGFEKPLDTPTISWIDNLGNGSVYVDWNNVAADKFSVSYKLAAEGNYIEAVKDITEGNYTITGLTEGEKYSVKVTASKEGFDSQSDEATIKVGKAEQQWYTAAVGSATEGAVTISGSNKISVKTGDPVKAEDITNTDKTITFDSVNNGKVADSEDGIFYYYTKINPNTENFKITATFKVTDTTTNTLDTQTGFGIYASDVVGYGTKDTKYFNSYSVGNFKASNTPKGNFGHANVSRSTTGYTSYNTEDNNGVTRTLNSSNIFSVQPENDKLKVDDTYTYTLEKTNDAIIATMKDADNSIVWSDVSAVMVQENGSMAIGVMSTRAIGVEVSDIKFEKSAGSASGSTEVKKIQPQVNVYSAAKTGDKNYTFIAGTNVAGKVELTANGKNQSADITANGIVKIPVTLWNEAGINDISYSFTPDKNAENLTSYDTISGKISVSYNVFGKTGESIYVSPTGKAGNEGTKDNPLDFQTALDYAQAGQTIVMLDGTYAPLSDYVINRSQKGTAENPITVVPLNEGKVVLDGSKMGSSNGLLTMVGEYWHVYGLEIMNSPGKGVSISGNNNTLEMCTIHTNGNSGLQISRYNGEPNTENMWPQNNLVKNCESYDNCDKGRNDADGFSAKLTCGEGNKFYGCISHHNIDDGWDLYAKSTTGQIGAVTIENSICYNNGWLTTDDITQANYNYGEGNGFKLGGENMYGAHVLKNCISYNNYAKGITSNSCPDCKVINCTSFDNSLSGKAYNISLYTKTSNDKAWVVDGYLSVVSKDFAKKVQRELGASNGIIYSLRSESNFFYDGTRCVNNLGVESSTSWFENVDTSVAPTRNANGTIDMHGLLKLKVDSAVPANTGARLDTTSEKAISVKPEFGKSVEHKYGEWTVTKKATCTENGEEHRVCADCGNEETREIKALGHKYATEWTVDKEATTLEEGSKSHHCLNAGCTEVTDVTVIPKSEAPEKTDVKIEPTGNMKDSVKVDGIKNTDEILEFTESEVEAINKGTSVDIKVYVEDISKTVPKGDSEKIADTLKNNVKVKEYAVGSYINIDVIKKVGDKESKLTTTKKELQFEITLTGSLINKDSTKARTYKVLRIHDGNVDILDATYDETTNKLTFKTDKFSTYAIIYTDNVVEVKPIVDEPTKPDTESGNTEDSEVQAGDSMHAVPYALAMIISAGLIVLIASRKKKFVK